MTHFAHPAKGFDYRVGHVATQNGTKVLEYFFPGTLKSRPLCQHA